MSAPLNHITLIGAPLATSLAAAMIAARLPGGACELHIIHSSSSEKGIVYSRPDIRRVHQLLQITEDELRSKAGAKMIMALPVKLSSGEMFDMPLGDYGLTRRGCDFQHYWRRAYAAGRARDISHYNFALQLHSAGLTVADTPKDMPILDPAYQFDRAKYTSLLMEHARKSAPIKLYEDRGLKLTIDDNRYNVVLSGRAVKTDFIIDMRSQKFTRHPWAFNCLNIPMNDVLPGLVLFRIKSALERLFSLWPDRALNPVESREYNRLAAEEQSHIDDMMSLLSCKNKTDHYSERLQRKISLFQSRGRVAYEDYDIFTKAEWMTALRVSKFMQSGYDRLSDRESLDDIAQWLELISQRIDVYIAAMKDRRL